jgi:hypothetical protein
MRLELEYFDPTMLLVKTEQELDSISNSEIFNKPKYQKLTEAWCAAMFGIGFSRYVSSCEVAVNESETNLDADFYIKTDAVEWPFQLAEVMEPGRKRGKEYKENPKAPTRYRPNYARKNAVKWVCDGIKKKIKKNYADSENLNLTVYMNFSSAKFEYKNIEEEVKNLPNEFYSVWLLSNTHMCSLTSKPALGEMLGWGEVRSIEDYYL